MWFRTWSRFGCLLRRRAIEQIHRGEDALADPAFDRVGSPVRGSFQCVALLAHRRLEHVILEGVGRYRADADAQSRVVGTAQRLLDALQALVSSTASRRPQPD